jgi:hypothetical protein
LGFVLSQLALWLLSTMLGGYDIFWLIMSSLEDIDTSSGALGSVVHRTLDHLIPILISGPVDVTTRSAWLERLFQAVNGRWCAVPRASRGSMSEIAAHRKGSKGDARFLLGTSTACYALVSVS